MKSCCFILSFLSVFYTYGYLIEKNIDTSCKKIHSGPFAFSYPKDLYLECFQNFSISASFLWMSFYEKGLEYSINVDETTTQKQKLDFNPGFRVNFSYDRDLFYINIGWTYISFKSDKLSSPGINGLLGLFLPPNSGSLTGASARMSGNFNTLDINISKPYHVSRYYVSNPKVGIQTAWIDQVYHVRYFIINNKHNVYCKNDFWGIGLETGYDAEFVIGKSFVFYADILSAILFSKFDISQNAETLTIYHYDLSENFFKVLPNVRIGLGFFWIFSNKIIKAKLKIGYEFQQWWSMNQFKRPVSTDPSAFKSVSKNDLTFNGFIISLQVDI